MSEPNPWIDALARSATVHLRPYAPHTPHAPASPHPSHDPPNAPYDASGTHTHAPGTAHPPPGTAHTPAAVDRTPMWGSGFFVAPGLVLTAAHVLLPHLARDRNLTFAVCGGDGVNDGIPVPARLEAWLLGPADDGTRPPQAPSPGEDLALVRLLDDTVTHACVWLADRAVQHVGVLRAYGYRPGSRDGRPCAVPWSGDTEINVRDSDYGLRFRPDIEFPDGVSGGPLLDPETGAVVALLKARRGVRDGGLAVSVLALRRFGPVYGRLVCDHDAWHGRPAAGDRDTWIDAQHADFLRGTTVHGGQWTPRDRCTALRELAALPPPPDGPTVEALARQAISGHHWPQAQERGPGLHSWRDGHGLLYEDTWPLDSMIMLRYLQLVALYVASRGGDAGRLTEWVGQRLAEHGRSHMTAFVTDARLPAVLEADADADDPAGPGVAPQTVQAAAPYPEHGCGTTAVVLLDPVIGSAPVHFFWQIWIDDGDGEPALYAADRSAHGHRPGDLVQALRPSLTDVFRTRDRAGHPVPLEVALPPDHFGIAVHRWRFDDIAALDDVRHLGAQRRVVLRSLERRGEPDKLWLSRWQGLLGQRRLSGWRVPEPGVAPHERQFRLAPQGAVPVICRAVGRGLGQAALRGALDGGHGVVLWHVDGHASGGCADACEELHARAARLLEHTESVTELPERLRRLRQEVAVQHTGQRWAEPLALLYDDPGRPLPAEDLTPLDAPL